MIIGIGVDLVELTRIKNAQKKNPKFAEKILTEKELNHFNKLSSHRQTEFLSGRFAAKEAFSKALGTGIGKDFSFHDLEILPNEKNKPIASSAFFNGKIHLSITHSRENAIAQVILENNMK